MGETLSDETNNEATELSNQSGEAHEVTEPVSRPQSDRKSREGAEALSCHVAARQSKGFCKQEYANVPSQICANLVINYKKHLVGV